MNELIFMLLSLLPPAITGGGAVCAMTVSPENENESVIPSLVAQQNAEKKTRVRLSSPRGTFNTGYYTRLDRVEITAKNVGEVEARDVVVTLTTPGGNHYGLSGPSSIAAHAEAIYVLSLSEVVASTKEIEAEVTCSNCYP